MERFVRWWKENCLKWWPLQIVIGALAIFLVGPLAIWFFDDSPAIRIMSASVDKQSVRIGDTVTALYKVDYQRKGCTVFFDLATKDAAGWVWPGMQHISRVVDHFGITDLGFPMVIPKKATPGAADFASTYGWYCNPLQRFMNNSEPLPPLTVTVVADSTN